jgi:tRNA pseudouridine55 synthase
MQGIVNLLKPTGITSSDAVVRVRGILRKIYGERYKVGHLGTLDPGASGVLPIAIGRATRLFDILASGRKVYRAGITFGFKTETGDSYGQVIERNPNYPSIEDLNSILPQFTGTIKQIPPKYSAINFDGTKAYKLARQGIEFALNARETIINNLAIECTDNPLYFTLNIDCMGGTYIRTLVEDIANELNMIAYMSSLIRLESCGLRINDSVTLAEFESSPKVIETEDMLINYQSFTLAPSLWERFNNGLEVKPENMPEGLFRLYSEGVLLAVAHSENGVLKADIRL